MISGKESDMRKKRTTIATSTGDIEVLKRRRLTSIIRKAAWLNVKVGFVWWGLAMMFLPPVPVLGVQGQFFHYIWTGMTVLGAAISVVGISISFSKDLTIVRRRAVPVELTGLSMMAIGPIVYWFTQLNLTYNGVPGNFESRYALSVYAYVVVAFVLARATMVIPRFHKEK